MNRREKYRRVSGLRADYARERWRNYLRAWRFYLWVSAFGIPLNVCKLVATRPPFLSFNCLSSLAIFLLFAYVIAMLGSVRTNCHLVIRHSQRVLANDELWSWHYEEATTCLLEIPGPHPSCVFLSDAPEKAEAGDDDDAEDDDEDDEDDAADWWKEKA